MCTGTAIRHSSYSKLNYVESTEFVKYLIKMVFEPTISCVRDRNVTTVPGRHR